MIEVQIPFKVYLCGAVVGQDGVERPSPPSLTASPPRIWTLAKQFCEKEWNFSIVGMRYGRCIKKLYLITGARYGRQVTWSIGNRKTYTVRANRFWTSRSNCPTPTMPT
eukprot:4223039-Pyramimonas_sp.AAC.1